MTFKPDASTFRPIDDASPRSKRMVQTPMDRHIGGRIKRRRIELGMTAQAMGDELHVSRQQIEKWERAGNRLSCGKLHDIAVILNIPAGWFFEDFVGGQVGTGTSNIRSSPALLEVAGMWERLRPDQRKTVRSVVEGLAASAAAAPPDETE